MLDALQRADIEEVLVASSAAVGSEMRGRLDLSGGAKIRYLEQEAPVDLPTAIGMAAPLVGDAPCVVHRATGLLDEPLARFVTRIRDTPDALLILHQAPSPAEHLNPAIRTCSTSPNSMPTMPSGCPERGCSARAMPIVVSSPWPLSDDVDLTRLGRRISAARGAFHVELAESWR